MKVAVTAAPPGVSLAITPLPSKITADQNPDLTKPGVSLAGGSVGIVPIGPDVRASTLIKQVSALYFSSPYQSRGLEERSTILGVRVISSESTNLAAKRVGPQNVFDATSIRGTDHQNILEDTLVGILRLAGREFDLYSRHTDPQTAKVVTFYDPYDPSLVVLGICYGNPNANGKACLYLQTDQNSASAIVENLIHNPTQLQYLLNAIDPSLGRIYSAVTITEVLHQNEIARFSELATARNQQQAPVKKHSVGTSKTSENFFEKLWAGTKYNLLSIARAVGLVRDSRISS